MKRLHMIFGDLLPALIWLGLTAGAAIALSLLSSHPAEALPEYANRTGETCAVCHVNPGGGGPRTLRGLLWAAQGRADQVPSLPNQLIAPGVSDGADLYGLGCAGCHGAQAEGLYAMGLVQTGITPSSIRSYVRRGIPSIGMPAFEGQFTPAQLEALVSYVGGLADGSVLPPPRAYPLPEARFRCGPAQGTTSPAEAAADAPCVAAPARRAGGN